MRCHTHLRGEGVAVEVELKGAREKGKARVLEGGGDELSEAVRRFIAAVPRDAAIYGLKLDDNKQVTEASLAAQVADLVVVEVDLSAP